MLLVMLVFIFVVGAAAAAAADSTAATAMAAAASAPPGLILPLAGGSPLRFGASACHHRSSSGSVAAVLMTAPTLGLGAFTVAWGRHSVTFSQPGRGLTDACRLPAGAPDRIRVTVTVADNGTVGLVVEAGDGGGEVCRFSAAAAAAASSVHGGSDHFVAVGPFDGCVEVGGRRHCFGSFGCDSDASSLPPEEEGRELVRRRRATCSPGDCKNGGSCNNVTANPICICPLPFIPPYCSAAANYCNQLQPELNITSLPVCINASCSIVLVEPYFNCSCEPGFEGVRCQTETNECAPQPCGGRGLCSDLLGNYSCGCYSGWQGRNCEDDTDDCTASVCSSRDRCIDGNSTCSCKQGWRGSNCSQVDHCAIGVCPNGTGCVSLEPSGFECVSAATFGHQLATPSPEPSLRLSPTGGLSEPLATAVGRARARLSNTSSTSSSASAMTSQLLTVASGDRRLLLSLSTTDGQLTVSLDNQTASVSVNASLATGEFFAFNVSAEPGLPLTLSVVSGNESAVTAAQSPSALSNASVLTLDSVAMVTLGAGFKGCLEGLRLNSRLLPLASNWSGADGQPGFVWLANQSSLPTQAAPLIGCLGDPVCDSRPCLNSGQCLDQWNSRACQCPAGYSGPTCGVVDCAVVACGGGAATAGVSTPVVVVLCVLALLVVVVVIVVVLVKLARSRRSETGQYKPSKEESSHDRPANGVRDPDTDLDDNFVLGNLQVARL